jgi:hypothetical protein
MLINLFILILIFQIAVSQESPVEISINNTAILDDPAETTHIFTNGRLNSAYDDTIFNQFLNC